MNWIRIKTKISLLISKLILAAGDMVFSAACLFYLCSEHRIPYKIKRLGWPSQLLILDVKVHEFFFMERAKANVPQCTSCAF